MLSENNLASKEHMNIRRIAFSRGVHSGTWRQLLQSRVEDSDPPPKKKKKKRKTIEIGDDVKCLYYQSDFFSWDRGSMSCMIGVWFLTKWVYVLGQPLEVHVFERSRGVLIFCMPWLLDRWLRGLRVLGRQELCSVSQPCPMVKVKPGLCSIDFFSF